MYYGVPNYEPDNVAPLIEQFAGILGLGMHDIAFRYQDRLSGQYFDVSHPPGDKLYGPEWNNREPSAAMELYLQYARNSKALEQFAMDNDITYFLPFS